MQPIPYLSGPRGGAATSVSPGAFPLLAPDGASGTPSYSFSSEATLGFYRKAAGVVGVTGSLNPSAANSFTLGTNNAEWLSVLGRQFVVGDSSNTATLTYPAGVSHILEQRATSNAQAFRVYGTTTGPKYVSLSHDGTNGILDTSSASGLLSLAPTNATSVLLGKKISSYNAIATAGQGVPIVVAAGRATAQAGANASVSTFTVGAADGSFEVSANVLVTTATTHSFSVTVAYTDEGSTARTLTLNFTNLAGAFSTLIVNTGGAVPYESPVFHIRCKTATAITIATTGTFTTVVYNVEGVIKQTA